MEEVRVKENFAGSPEALPIHTMGAAVLAAGSDVRSPNTYRVMHAYGCAVSSRS